MLPCPANFIKVHASVFNLPIVSGRYGEVSDREIHGKSHLLTNSRVKAAQVRERCPPLVVSCAVAQSYKSITSDPAPMQASPRPSCPNGATGAASSPPLTAVVNVVNWNVRLKN